MPSRRRRQVELERVLGTPALFATAYGNVGSSIYYALGLTAVFALGLTPLVFVVAGVIFAATAATYAEGTVRFPEAGGSSSFARLIFNASHRRAHRIAGFIQHRLTEHSSARLLFRDAVAGLCPQRVCHRSRAAEPGPGGGH